MFHPDIEVYQSEKLLWGGSYQGYDEGSQFFGRLSEAIESEVDTDLFVDDEADHVVVVRRLRGRARAMGKEFDVGAVHVWTMKEGKATKFESYVDTPTVRESLE